MEHPVTPRKKLSSWIFWLKQKLLANSSNYLEVTAEGKFYLGVTIALGVGALISGNNILYLLDAILLSALAISGFVSDRIITGIEIEVHPKQALASQPTEDRIKITNRRSYSLFFIKIYEISDSGTQCIAEMAEIPAHSSSWLTSRATYEKRGLLKVDHYSVGTYYPFGLALKKYPHRADLIRLVWPKRTKPLALNDDTQDSQRHQRWGSKITEGEVREYSPGEDSRNIVWTISSKFDEDLYVRPRRAAREKRELLLDLSERNTEHFEKQISEIATTLYGALSTEIEISLKLKTVSGYRVIHDPMQAIAVLSQVQPERPSP